MIGPPQRGDGRMLRARLVACLGILAAFVWPAVAQEASWKAGAAARRITPEHSMWMAGYANRTKPSEGTALDLYAKALALEDAAGTRQVIVTCDLIGIPRSLRDRVAHEVTAKFGLPGEALLLNASHTHCGPVVRTGPSLMFELAPEQQRRIEEYAA